MARLRRLIRRIAGLGMPLYAANVCYFLVLSLFPGLLLILASLRYTRLSANDLILFLEDLLPGALLPFAEGLIVSTYYNAGAAAISLSAVAAVWSASRGIYGLMAGLNRVYGVREDRGWLRKRLISVAYLGLFLLVLLGTLVVHVFGRNLEELLLRSRLPAARLLMEIVDFRMVILLLVQTVVLCLLYAALPNRDNRLREGIPGAVLAALGWQGFSKVFSVYVLRSYDYTVLFGPVYAMALGMLWLYCCVLIVLFGGAVNRFGTNWRKKQIF